MKMIDIQEDILKIDTSFENNDTNLILSKVRLLCKIRVAWLRHIWTKANENLEGDFNIHAEIDGYLEEKDTISLQKAWIKTQPAVQKLAYYINELDDKINEARESRFNKLSQIFSLNNTDRDILQLCLALAIEPDLARIFAYLHDNSAKNYISEPLIAGLLGYNKGFYINANSPLKVWSLIKESKVQSGDLNRFDCDIFIKNWLLGSNDLDENIFNFVTQTPIQKVIPNWPVSSTAFEIKKILDSNKNVKVYVKGINGSGRKSFAALVCNKCEFNSIAIDVNTIPENLWPMAFKQLQRYAFLQNTALIWYGDGLNEKKWPKNYSNFPLQFIISEANDFELDENSFVNLKVDVPKLTFAERLFFWDMLLPNFQNWDSHEAEKMILTYESTIAEIVTVANKLPQNIEECYDGLRLHSETKLGKLAQLMPNSFTFSDLVVSENVKNSLEEFVFEATERVQFWEQSSAKRLFPQGRSLIGLFTGNPGTGKTMAAQVIANSLQMDLYRIDLSSVISKYIGESSKNIEKILNRAKNMNVVLFFDEADSLFGKRTEIKDAHDRYANTDTNYLLQEIENYPGTIILATNKFSNIDNGFIRRFRYVIEFREPDAQLRLELWKNILSEITEKETTTRLADSLLAISKNIELTGAQIKQALLSSLFLAKKDGEQINTKHIMRGIERELMKQGKGLNKQQLQHLNLN